MGALQREKRTFIVALLACGWPNNKTYKWADTRTLMQYGLDHYTYRDVYEKNWQPEPVAVTGGAPADGMWVRPQTVPTELLVPTEEQTLPVLLGPEESVKVVYEGKRQIAAPVKKGTEVGRLRYVPVSYTHLDVYKRQGHIAAMSATCSMDIQAVPGMKNMLFGGEGIFNTVVTGPGHIWLQTMPISNVAGALRPYIPTGNS